MKYLKGLFFMIQSLWAAPLELEQRCFSKVLLASIITLNITRSSDSASLAQYHPELMGLAFIVLLVLSFKFIYNRSHHLLTLLIKITIQGWHNSNQSEVVNITVKLAFLYGKILLVVQKEQLQAKYSSPSHYDTLWPIREKQRQNIQRPKSRAWRELPNGCVAHATWRRSPYLSQEQQLLSALRDPC